MATQLHFKYGFKIGNIFFGWGDDNKLYQLPYTAHGRYFPLREVKQKWLKNGWVYYHVRRIKIGTEKIRAMLQPVDWVVDKPAEIEIMTKYK